MKNDYGDLCYNDHDCNSNFICQQYHCGCPTNTYYNSSKCGKIKSIYLVKRLFSVNFFFEYIKIINTSKLISAVSMKAVRQRVRVIQNLLVLTACVYARLIDGGIQRLPVVVIKKIISY